MKTTPCSCTVDTVYADGRKPEFYDDESLAVSAFRMNHMTMVQQETYPVLDPWLRFRYWAVHYRGQHVLTI